MGLKPVSVTFDASGRVVLMRLRGGWLTLYTAFATGRVAWSGSRAAGG
ncbi:MAG: hypothetical protein QXM71_05635 [Thermofilum sp.]